MEPLVSIIIPYYHGERFITETLTSLLEQNYSNLEIIIVSDGSSHESLDPIRTLIDQLTVTESRVKILLLHQENQGQAAARNLGLKHAQGDIIGILDQDDFWPSNRLAITIPFLTKDNPSLIAYDFVRGMTQKLQLQYDNSWKLEEPQFFPSLIGSALYTKKTIARVGLFDATMREGDDFDWNARLDELALNEKRIPDTTLIWRKHDTNQSDLKDHVKNGQLLSLKKKIERMRNAKNQNQ